MWGVLHLASSTDRRHWCHALRHVILQVCLRPAGTASAAAYVPWVYAAQGVGQSRISSAVARRLVE